MTRQLAAILGTCLIFTAGACKTEQPKTEPPRQTAQQTAKPSGEAAAPAPAPAGDDVAPFAADPHQHMKAHFVRANKLEDAVLAGNLTEAQTQGRWLATHDKEEVPEGWRRYLQPFQAEASAVGNATSIEAAAAAVAGMAAACGGCHAANHVRPKIGTSPIVGRASNVKAHMTEQLQALDRLWDGLMIPSDQAWREGAGLLARVAVPEKALEKEGLDKADSAKVLAQTLRRLSASAAKAAKADRPQAYAELLTTCVGCHVSVRRPVTAAPAAMNTPPQN